MNATAHTNESLASTTGSSSAAPAETTPFAPSAAEREAIIEQHMPLVRKLARQIGDQCNGHVPREELIAFGVEGLLEAMTRYVPGGSATLATFAYYRIRGCMLDGIGKIAPLSRKCYRQARAAGDKHAIYRDDSGTEYVHDYREGTSPEDLLAGKQMSALLKDALAKLPEEQRHLVARHYFHGETLLDAGKDLGISKSWACRKHAKALRTLRVELEKAGGELH